MAGAVVVGRRMAGVGLPDGEDLVETSHSLAVVDCNRSRRDSTSEYLMTGSDFGNCVQGLINPTLFRYLLHGERLGNEKTIYRSNWNFESFQKGTKYHRNY